MRLLMTLDPILLKAYEYCAHVKEQGHAKPPYFNPDGATYRPWSQIKTTTKGLALATLKRIQRNFPSLKLFVLRTEGFALKHHPRLQELCATISIIRIGCKKKLAKAPKKVCAYIYEARVNSACSRIITAVTKLSLIDITHKIDELLPLLKDFGEAKKMRNEVKAIRPAVEGVEMTSKIASLFRKEKSCLLSRISLYKVFWRMERIVEEFLRSKMNDDLFDKLCDRMEAASDKFYKHTRRHPSLCADAIAFKIAAKSLRFNFLCEGYIYKTAWKAVSNLFARLV